MNLIAAIFLTVTLVASTSQAASASKSAAAFERPESDVQNSIDLLNNKTGTLLCAKHNDPDEAVNELNGKLAVVRGNVTAEGAKLHVSQPAGMPTTRLYDFSKVCVTINPVY